ncbi:hypothetical protein BpHYR1_038385 [Brachionus plicatilis]|uniref:Uncharacterized protein n=1 Tax=Brachionus plicatilis TaxID=10195 RepID=A0A3M7RR34_BRAPC|nr:hypothetical protein BpHYR1_038385 [Brachionus plicatilis]
MFQERTLQNMFKDFSKNTRNTQLMKTDLYLISKRILKIILILMISEVNQQASALIFFKTD